MTTRAGIFDYRASAWLAFHWFGREERLPYNNTAND